MKKYVLPLLAIKSTLSFATTLTWQGTTSSMNTAGNWSPAQVPVNGDALIFPLGASQLDVSNDITGTLSPGALTISDAYTLTGNPFSVGSGSPLTFTSTGATVNIDALNVNGGIWTIHGVNFPGNTIQSPITGSFRINCSGGYLILSGNNSFSGDLWMGHAGSQPGTIFIGTSNALSSAIDVDIAQGSFLDLNNLNVTTQLVDTSTNPGYVSMGTGTLTFRFSGFANLFSTLLGTGATFEVNSPSGSLFIRENNSYSSMANPGATIIQAGSVTADSVSSFGTYSQLTVASGATLNLNGFDNIFQTLNGGGTINLGTATMSIAQGSGSNFSGTIGGSGGLTLLDGTQTLSGSNNYTGTTTVNGGTLLAGSTSAFGTGPTTVTQGGTLNFLTFPNTVGDVANSGTIETSATIFAQSYTQNGSGTLQTNVSSLTNFGSVEASNSATLDGKLIVRAMPGFSSNAIGTIDLLTGAGGRFNQFATASFENFPPSLIPNLIYSNNAVALNLSRSNPAPTQGSLLNVSFNAATQYNLFLLQKTSRMRWSMGVTQPTAVAYNSDKENEFMAAGDDFFPLFDEEEGLLAQETQPGILQKPHQLTERMEVGSPWSVYAGPIASCGNIHSKRHQIGLGYASTGLLAGFDTLFEDHEQCHYEAGWGAMLAYQRIWTHAHNDWGRGTLDYLQGSFYGTIVPKSVPDLSFEGIVGYGFTWKDLHRNTGIDKQLTAVGHTHDNMGNILFGVEYKLSGETHTWLPREFTIVPLATLQYLIFHESEYKESGAGVYDLKINAYTPKSLSSLLGARFNYLFLAKHAQVELEIDAGWQREYLNHRIGIQSTAFNVTDFSTTTSTVASGRNGLILTLDLLTTFSGGWLLEANTSYQWNNLFYDLFFYLGFGKDF